MRTDRLTMAIVLNRYLGAPPSMDPGMWTKSTGPIQLSCPLCDRLAVVTESHAVDPAGTVTPIWTCPTCPFRDWIRLGDFGEDVLT